MWPRPVALVTVLSEGRPRHICKRAIEILMKKLEKCIILQHYSK